MRIVFLFFFIYLFFFYWNAYLEVCFLNIWCQNTGLDLKTTEKNIWFLIGLRHSSETLLVWKTSRQRINHVSFWFPYNKPCITCRENFLINFQHLVRVLLFLRFLLYWPYWKRTSVEVVRLLKETQLIRSPPIESITREAKPYVQKRPNSRFRKLRPFQRKTCDVTTQVTTESRRCY